MGCSTINANRLPFWHFLRVFRVFCQSQSIILICPCSPGFLGLEDISSDYCFLLNCGAFPLYSGTVHSYSMEDFGDVRRHVISFHWPHHLLLINTLFVVGRIYSSTNFQGFFLPKFSLDHQAEYRQRDYVQSD